MKRVRLNIKVVLSLTTLLFIIVLAQSIFEYRSSRSAIINLMSGQAEALILSVARAGEKGIIAYEYQQREISNHLITFAKSLDQLEQAGIKPDISIFDRFSSGNLDAIIIYNNHGEVVRLLSKENSPQFELDITAERLSPIFKGELSDITLGLIKSFNGKSIYAVGVRRSKGGVFVVGIDATELLSLRRNFGAGSVINYISDSPGVEYVGLLNQGIILAASSNFPKQLQDKWYSTSQDNGNDFKTRLTNYKSEKTGNLFEAIGMFKVADQFYGNIVIGINTDQFDLIRSNLKQDIFWRSFLFLIIAIIAIAGVMIKQNYNLLEFKYDEIRNEVRQLEADRVANEKLTAMGELAGGVAHEIRNPLNAIRVILQRLQREFKPISNNDEYIELTEILKKETDRVSDTVSQFLNIAKPPTLNKAKGNLHSCINEIITFFQHRAESKGCIVVSEIREIPAFSFDSELCKQAILNLLENALAVVNDEGIIKISTSYSSKNVYINIEDNGPGIPNDLKSRVFDLYYTTKPSGTGLGLPTVLRIVKEHGGRIELLDSSLGGAQFKLELPIV